MTLQPIFEHEASDAVRENYLKIKTALQLSQLPLFFAYLGPFPNYLQYITNQLTTNLSNPQFQSLTEDFSFQLKTLIKDSLSESEEINEWLHLYKNSPSFYYFQNDLRHIFLTNIKLAFIFISLREALKGWAIAARKISSGKSSHKNAENKQSSPQKSEKAFIFGDFNANIGQIGSEPASINAVPTIKPHIRGNQLTTRENLSPEKDFLPMYLNLCRKEFLSILKTQEFLVLRVGVEEMILSSIHLIPEIIFSPINITLKLTGNNPNYADLLYFLSEHFPTYSMQRMLFSGYMMK